MIQLTFQGVAHQFLPREDGKYNLTEAFKISGSKYSRRPGKFIQRSHGAMRRFCETQRGADACTWSTEEVFLGYCTWVGFGGKTVVNLQVERAETFFGKEVVENLFSGYEIHSQFMCGPYRIDWYIPECNIIVELDEMGHRYYDKEAEKEREEYICSALGAKLLRYTM
ncbi:hypothetical protein CB7_112 [Pectobacterium phage vB_PatM_CB7]|nr:hypothetical protein CB7_112 [Pectobacterium phage vB_PatM_CB7]